MHGEGGREDEVGELLAAPQAVQRGSLGHPINFAHVRGQRRACLGSRL